MKNEEILKKVVLKAFNGGWKFEDYQAYVPAFAFELNEDRVAELVAKRWEWWIFKHDFAKAFWGEKPKCEDCEGDGVIWHPMWKQWHNEEHGKYADLIGKNIDHYTGEDDYDRKVLDFFGVSDKKLLPSEEPDCLTCEGTGEGISWKYHLQQMVLEENPIKYLEKLLDK